MKKTLAILMVLALTAVFCMTAFAEDAASSDTADTTAPTAESTTDDTALQEAMEAYRTARQAEKMTDYETELKSMVEAGQLTQEQADLLLNAAKEQEALRSGTCPECGYQFQNGNGKMGGKGRGMNGMNGNVMGGHGGRH